MAAPEGYVQKLLIRVKGPHRCFLRKTIMRLGKYDMLQFLFLQILIERASAPPPGSTESSQAVTEVAQGHHQGAHLSSVVGGVCGNGEDYSNVSSHPLTTIKAGGKTPIGTGPSLLERYNTTSSSTKWPMPPHRRSLKVSLSRDILSVICFNFIQGHIRLSLFSSFRWKKNTFSGAHFRRRNFSFIALVLIVFNEVIGKVYLGGIPCEFYSIVLAEAISNFPPPPQLKASSSGVFWNWLICFTICSWSGLGK